MICEVFAKLLLLLEARGVATPLSAHPGPIEIVIDGTWRMVINGHTEPQPWGGADLPPFHALVEFNGWPAGLLGPHGGLICAGTVGNEDNLLAALDAALAAQQGGGADG